MKRIYLQVTWHPRDEFPLDMLRYDNCSIHSRPEHNSVIVVKESKKGKPVPFTEERWKSFGCVVKKLKPEEI